MKDTPILFTPENAQKVHEGTKTQTRRIVTPQPINSGDIHTNDAWYWKGGPALLRASYGADYVHTNMDALIDAMLAACPYGTVGDRLWVRESIYIDHFEYDSGPLPKEKPQLEEGMLVYRGEGSCCQQFAECECGGKGAPWRPSIHMPKWACRTWLELTGVRVERLQAITNEDAKAEGILNWGEREHYKVARDGFRMLWLSIHGPGSWDLNPWVWVLEYRKVKPSRSGESYR